MGAKSPGEEGILMGRTNAIGMLGFGLAIAAAVTAAPGIASADSTTVDPAAIDTAAFDPSALIADSTSGIPGLNLAISIDGYTLFQSGDATAYSGTGDYAIAYGDGSDAEAGTTGNPGTGDFAFADGTDSTASSGIGNFDSASAIGSGSTAVAGGGDGDTAFADGTDTGAIAGGTYTPGDVNIVDVPADGSFASAIGDNDYAYAGSEFANTATASTGDIASIIGNSSDAYAGVGDFDFAGVFGDSLNSTATIGNFLFDLMPSL
jgi:hypothetical protein